jgi:hypothetical protein
MGRSSGPVFHPGHHELHGITVVVETSGPRTYVGRFDTQDEHGVHLLDVAVHDGSAPSPSREEFLRRSATFGVRVELKHVLVPGGEVVRISRLDDVPAGR